MERSIIICIRFSYPSFCLLFASFSPRSVTFIFLDAQWRRPSQITVRLDSYNCSASRNTLESVYCPLVSLHRHASLPLFDRAGKKMRSCNNSVEQGQWCNSNIRAVGTKKKKKKIFALRNQSFLKTRSRSITEALRWVRGHESHVRRYHLIFAPPPLLLFSVFRLRFTERRIAE